MQSIGQSKHFVEKHTYTVERMNSFCGTISRDLPEKPTAIQKKPADDQVLSFAVYA